MAREVGTEGSSAVRRRCRRRRHLEGPHRQRQLHGRQPHRAGAQHRRGHHRRRQGATSPKITVDVEGRDPGAQEHHQHDGRPAELVRLEVTRVAREVGTEGKLGGQAEVRASAARGRTSPTTSTFMAATSPPGAQHRRGHHRRRGGRPLARRSRSTSGEILELKEHHQHDGRSAQRVRVGSDARRARGRHRGKLGGQGGAGRRRHLEGPDRQRQLLLPATSPRRCATSRRSRRPWRRPPPRRSPST